MVTQIRGPRTFRSKGNSRNRKKSVYILSVCVSVDRNMALGIIVHVNEFELEAIFVCELGSNRLQFSRRSRPWITEAAAVSKTIDVCFRCFAGTIEEGHN